jgi:uncharacterized DUF497 family protein
VEISYDPAKRAATLRERGLDFEDAVQILACPTFTHEDDRFAYDERRYLTYGLLNERLIMFAWTPEEGGRRIISMRKCNEREKRRFAQRLG